MFVMWQYGLLNQPPQGYPDRDCHELYSYGNKKSQKRNRIGLSQEDTDKLVLPTSLAVNNKN
jgi:hypothetical protein